MFIPEDNRENLLVLVGVGPGLGVEIVKAFIAVGYRVAGLSRMPDTAAKLAGTPGYHHYACDVTHYGQVMQCLQNIETDLGTVNVVVYNPMQLLIKPFLDLTAGEFESVWRVSCLGAMFVAQAVLPSMLKSGGGTLIFTGATASIRGSAKFASLAVAKFGLRGLAQSLAREFGPSGVHVIHTVIDGLIWSPQTVSRFSPEQEACLLPEHIAQNYLQLVQQPRSSWTHEVDMRPSDGKF